MRPGARRMAYALRRALSEVNQGISLIAADTLKDIASCAAQMRRAATIQLMELQIVYLHVSDCSVLDRYLVDSSIFLAAEDGA